MNEWFAGLTAKVKELWTKWSVVQKVVFFGVIGGAVIGLLLLARFGAAPSMVPLLSRPIADSAELNRILTRLDQENVEYRVDAESRVLVPDLATAQRLRAILTREDLLPVDTNPWELFDIERWTITDFERNVNLRRAITSQVEQHIRALEDVDSASVTLVMPERALFAEDQNPVTASIIITPRPGSDIRENRQKIQGIERLVQYAVEGLLAENITINDQSGRRLNDFADMAEFDRLELTRRELQIKRSYEQQYIAAIRSALARIFTEDRVQVPNIDVELDFGKRATETEEFFPITTVVDNPRTPFDETEYVLSIERSTRDFVENFEGSGFNPEGPPGTEGQVPPAYQDLEGNIGRYSRTEAQVNNEVNRRVTSEQGSPAVQRISVAVAVDGVWRWTYDEAGNVVTTPDGSIVREYTPLSQSDLENIQSLVEHAVGFNRDRGDTVTVRTLPFDRSAIHNAEDDAFRRARQVQLIVLSVLVGLAVILVAFIAFRLVSRELERRRRLREEELARQHQAMREAALRSAEEESQEVEMSVEDRARLELVEHAINMAREHPEDVAQLLRTWMMEE